MNVPSLQEIKTYLTGLDKKPYIYDVFNRNADIEQHLTTREKLILFSVGMPRTGGFVKQINLLDLSIKDNRYIPIQTGGYSMNQGDLVCIDIETHQLVYWTEHDERYSIANSGLEAYLAHIYIYTYWIDNTLLADGLGTRQEIEARGEDATELYAFDLEKEFESYNSDIKDYFYWLSPIDTLLMTGI